MLSSNLEIYESCDLEKPQFPNRSRLYHLEPVGIGTPHVESLTSYISRLAEAHCLYPHSLVTKIIASELKQTFIKNCSSRNLGALFKKSRFINSHGQIAQEINQSLTKLTLQENLEILTISRYSQVLSHRNLLKNNKSWCPACYEQWRISGQTIYEPLYWSLADVKVCPIHYQPLQNICPHCEQSIPWLTGKTKVGYCSNCDLWLGNSAQVPHDHSESELNKYFWIVKNIGRLFSFIPKEKFLIEKVNISKSLNLVVNSTHEGNIAAFAKTFELPKNTVWMWCREKSLPELRSLLKICYCFDISLLDFVLFQEKAFQSLQLNSQRLPSSCRAKRVSPKTIEINTIENHLQDILHSSDTSPLTMKEVAERLGIDQRTLKCHFPSLCKAISAKYRSYQQASKARGIEACCKEIEQAVIHLYQLGEYPTEARVSKLISQPGYLRYKEVRNTLNDLINLSSG